MNKLRLGVNIDHVATIRNARGGHTPDPIRAAYMAAQAGADNITAHLREDRRHISDDDITRLMADIDIPLNLEMAATDEMLEIALRHKPYACCLVPEKREELTTEGGLDVVGQHNRLKPFIDALQSAGIKSSFFIDPIEDQIAMAAQMGVYAIEIHVGAFCEAHHAGDKAERDALLHATQKAAQQAFALGVDVHAGHGLCYETVGDIAAIEQIRELNIGHFLIGESIFCGLDTTIKAMRRLMDDARAQIT